MKKPERVLLAELRSEEEREVWMGANCGGSQKSVSREKELSRRRSKVEREGEVWGVAGGCRGRALGQPWSCGDRGHLVSQKLWAGA